MCRRRCVGKERPLVVQPRRCCDYEGLRPSYAHRPYVQPPSIHFLSCFVLAGNISGRPLVCQRRCRFADFLLRQNSQKLVRRPCDECHRSAVDILARLIIRPKSRNRRNPSRQYRSEHHSPPRAAESNGSLEKRLHVFGMPMFFFVIGAVAAWRRAREARAGFGSAPPSRVAAHPNERRQWCAWQVA